MQQRVHISVLHSSRLVEVVHGRLTDNGWVNPHPLQDLGFKRAASPQDGEGPGRAAAPPGIYEFQNDP